MSLKDTPGFVVNRVLMPMINEAVMALHEGIMTKEDIDTSMKVCVGHPMGPITLADMIGLDTCLAIMKVWAQHKNYKYTIIDTYTSTSGSFSAVSTPIFASTCKYNFSAF